MKRFEITFQQVWKSIKWNPCSWFKTSEILILRLIKLNFHITKWENENDSVCHRKKQHDMQILPWIHILIVHMNIWCRVGTLCCLWPRTADDFFVFHLDYYSVAVFEILISSLQEKKKKKKPQDVTLLERKQKLKDRNGMLSDWQNKRSFSQNQVYEMFFSDHKKLWQVFSIIWILLYETFFFCPPFRLWQQLKGSCTIVITAVGADVDESRLCWKSVCVCVCLQYLCLECL